MIYFVINIMLSFCDLWLINFFLFGKRNLFTVKKFNFNLCLQLLLLMIINIEITKNVFCNTFLYFCVLIIAQNQNKSSMFSTTKYLSFFMIFKVLISNLIILIITWTFDISIGYSLATYSVSYKLLIEIIIRYVQLISILSIINYKKEPKLSFHHFKLFSIFLSLYFSVVLIVNNDKLFIFRNVGRTFVFVIIVYNIALIFFDRFQTHHEELEYDHKQLKSETSSDSVYFEEHLKGNDDIRGIKHDMKNHMLVLKGYIESDSKKTALEYIQTIENEIEIASSTLHTGIPTVDSIITNKIKTMKKSNIQYKEKFKVICLGDIYDRDLALMLASALDNAIEAAIKSEDKKISLQMGTEANYLCITLINSIKRNSKPNFKKSSKEDSTKHGFGYKKIKTIVKKYDGNLDTEITKDKVIMTITLKLN